MHGWVARDEKGILDEEALYFYKRAPTRDKNAKQNGLWESTEPYWQLPTEWFPDVIAGQDCIPVTLKLNIEKGWKGLEMR